MASRYYVLSDSQCSDEYLQHYGVLGMKWGVRRARKKLANATTKEEAQKARDNLTYHKTKATEKIGALEKKGLALEKKSDKRTMKSDLKASKMKSKAAKYRQKEYGFFTSPSKAERLEFKARKLEVRADALLAKSNMYKAKIESNKTLIKTFQREMNTIDDLLMQKGKKFLS